LNRDRRVAGHHIGAQLGQCVRGMARDGRLFPLTAGGGEHLALLGDRRGIAAGRSAVQHQDPGLAPGHGRGRKNATDNFRGQGRLHDRHPSSSRLLRFPATPASRLTTRNPKGPVPPPAGFDWGIFCSMANILLRQQIARTRTMKETRLKSLLGSDNPDTTAGRIVRALSERGSLSGAQIARLTGLARSTVSTAVAELRQSGLVTEADNPAGPGAKSVGRPGTVLTLNPEAGTCIGVHLSDDDLRVAVADVSHSFISEETIRLPKDYGPELAAGILTGWVQRTYARHGLRLSSLLGLGVSVSAPVAPDGTVHRSSIVPTWGGVNVVDLFGQALGTTVLADNESNCTAIAEMIWGAARGESDFILFKLHGAGVGGSIVSGGQVMRGLAGGAGEFGHVAIGPDGPLCRCGNRGCLELGASYNPPLRELSRAHGRELTITGALALAQAGDAGARRIIDEIAEIAGRGLAIIASVLNPPLVLVSGPLVAAGPLLFDPLTASFDRHSLLKARELTAAQRTRFLPARLNEKGEVLGAVGLVLRHHGRLR
jgi:predicted NBD/HSP70 family sugar kinase/DNA-binding MarR family transcriptional regulator